MSRPKRTTPWLSRRGKGDRGVFYAFWYDERSRETKRLSLRTTDSAEAEARFAEFLLSGREIRQPRSRTLSIPQALDDYLEEHVKVNCADYTRQRDAVRHLKEFFGERPLDAIDVPLSREYTSARTSGLIGGGKRRKNKKAAPSTVRRELNVLVAAANHAIWQKRADKHLHIEVDLPPEKRLGQDDEAPYYDHEELKRIFKQAEAEGGEMEHFVKLLYYTGARRRSIEQLARFQVKWGQKRVLLQKPGKKTTKKRQPVVPIFNGMVAPLKAVWETGGEDILFKPRNWYRDYRDLVERAGIDRERAHPHVMRHTRATHLLQAGKSLYDVARLLGDQISTVERVYGHHSHDYLLKNLEE